MRLLNIEYWAGKDKRHTVVLEIAIRSGTLVCLRSNKIDGKDVNKIRDNTTKLNQMNQDDLNEWLKINLSSYNNALSSLKSGRYKIIEERLI